MTKRTAKEKGIDLNKVWGRCRSVRGSWKSLLEGKAVKAFKGNRRQISPTLNYAGSQPR